MPPLFTISSSGPDIPDGVYPVVLADIQGPRTVTAQRGPKAGQEIDLFDWIFHVDAPNTPYDQTPLNVSTSTASGPRSKMFAFLTALHGGRAPAIGTAFEKDQLVGRHALATVQKDEEGWLRITNLGALPANMQAAAVPQPLPAEQQAQPANGQPAAQPARQAVTSQAGENVPF